MAVGHVALSRAITKSEGTYQAVRKIVDGISELSDLRDALVQCKNAGTLDAYAVAQFGFTDPAAAVHALAEIESFLGKVQTDADVSGVLSCWKQLGAEFL